jgi:hypothetical protein
MYIYLISMKNNETTLLIVRKDAHYVLTVSAIFFYNNDEVGTATIRKENRKDTHVLKFTD